MATAEGNKNATAAPASTEGTKVAEEAVKMDLFEDDDEFEEFEIDEGMSASNKLNSGYCWRGDVVRLRGLSVPRISDDFLWFLYIWLICLLNGVMLEPRN